MYPNPSDGMIRFNGIMGEATIEIYDLSGKRAFTQANVISGADINTGNLEAGMYTVLVHDAAGSQPMTLSIR
jgi:hypothetical protein